MRIKDSYWLRLITAAIFVFLSFAGVGFAIYIMLVSSSVYVYVFGVFLLILSIIAGFFNTVSAYFYYKSFFYGDYFAKITAGLRPLRRFPTVAVGVPVKDENPKIVQKTLMRLREMNYPKDKMNVYLLDDSTNKQTSTELKAFCSRNKIRYLQRVSRTGFKAGNLNNMLNHSNEEFVAVFDYDEYLTNKNFLLDLIPYFQDERVGYVQTEKSAYRGNLLSDSVNLFDAFFFKFIQPARAFNNTAIFSGSCGVIRRKVLDEIGGFPEYIIEDTFFSFMSDMRNYKGLYIPKIYAYGQPVLDLQLADKAAVEVQLRRHPVPDVFHRQKQDQEGSPCAGHRRVHKPRVRAELPLRDADTLHRHLGHDSLLQPAVLPCGHIEVHIERQQ
jgi:cellulose synthase/poly-beta-1,6-N-acetylglucosamine synthase-like glycosyltransferase